MPFPFLYLATSFLVQVQLASLFLMQPVSPFLKQRVFLSGTACLFISSVVCPSILVQLVFPLQMQLAVLSPMQNLFLPVVVYVSCHHVVLLQSEEQTDVMTDCSN